MFWHHGNGCGIFKNYKLDYLNSEKLALVKAQILVESVL